MSQVYDEPIVVRLTQPVGPYPVGTEFGFKDVADAIRALGSSAYFTVVRTQDGDPIPPPTPEDLTEAERKALERARAARLIRGKDFDPLVPGPGEVIVGSADGPVARRAPEKTTGYRVAAIGDSITAGIHGAASPGYLYRDPGSWFTWLCDFSGGRLLHVKNAGIPSNTLQQMAARLDTDIIAHNPDICFILGGANNVGTHTAPQAGAIIAEMVDRLRVAGVRPVLCTLTPYQANATRVAEYNAWIRTYGIANGIAVLDLTSPLMNPATGGFKAGMSNDGLHPTEAGAIALGKAAAAQWSYTNPSVVPLATSATQATNLLTNGVFVGDANDDGLADGWAVTGPTGAWTHSLIADPAIVGNWQRLEKTTPGFAVVSQSIAAGSWSPGDVLRISGRAINDEDGPSSGGKSIRMNFAGGSPSSIRVLHAIKSSTGADPFVFSVDVVVPTGTTGISFQIAMGTGSDGIGSLRVAQLSVINEARAKG